jgi:tRNA A37 threonylcarbamoyladenosine dehydratase
MDAKTKSTSGHKKVHDSWFSIHVITEVTEKMNERYKRQSFLSSEAQNIIESIVVGIVGLGGGGSHIIQQLAHIGFKNFVLYDGDHIEESNLNRLVGSTVFDVEISSPKIDIARRVIRGLQPDSKITAYAKGWQEDSLQLRNCDLIFGCIDGFRQRRCNRRANGPQFILLGGSAKHIIFLLRTVEHFIRYGFASVYIIESY